MASAGDAGSSAPSSGGVREQESAVGLLDWLMHLALRRSRLVESKVVVEFDDVRVWCRAPDSPAESIAWSELESVAVRTTDAGPFAADFFWVLRAGAGRTVVIPGGATGAQEPLRRLQELPEFDNEAVIAAAASTDHRVFEC